MGSFPDGYKPRGLQYTPVGPKPNVWQERNAAITQKNREQREKSQVTTLRDVWARPIQEAPVSPRPFNPIGSMKMPPGDKDAEAAKKKYFGIVDEKTQIEQLEARIRELEQNGG